jgi:ring-1,2-phenylacetyl-CoA epoxidase subunit PaaE
VQFVATCFYKIRGNSCNSWLTISYLCGQFQFYHFYFLFFPLKITDIRRETADCVSVALKPAVENADRFLFQAGQYLTFKTTIGGQEVRRSYSICSSPDQGELRVAIKKVEGGVFSTYANQHLRRGDVLESMSPMGHFTLPTEPASAGRHYVFWAAGSGITPVISLIRTILRTEPTSTVLLVYGNRNGASVIFREEIEGLKNKNLHRFQIFHVLSRERVDNDLGFGRIDAEKVHLFFEKVADVRRGDEYYMCGPLEMIEAVREELKKREVPAKNVHFELFNAPVKAKKTATASDNYKKSTASIQLDGLKFDISIPEGMNILDAAQATGADLPFACKGGVCCTCRARLIEGEVEMEVNFALTEEETEQGYILTCQAIPKTDHLVVNFDAK